MAADLEVFSKRHACAQRVLAQYQNKTTKLAWYEKFGKKYYLASGVLTTGGDRKKFLCKTSFGCTGEELLELCDRLSKASRMPGTFNDISLGEGLDWSGAPTRLVLRDSDYAGLVLVRLKSLRAEIEVVEADDSDPDPDPMMEEDGEPITVAAEEVVWSECFEKFYFSKKDDWGGFKKNLLSLYEDIQLVTAVDAESTIPPATPSTVVPEQKQIAGPSQQSTTTKGGAAKRGGGGKRRKPNSELFPPVTEVFRKVVVILSCFMSHYRVSAKHCVRLYSKEMTETCLYNYESLVHLFDEECERIVYKIGKKLNTPQKGSTQLVWDET
jgi:hypothetical protein